MLFRSKFKGIDKISPAVAKVLRKYNDAPISSYDDFDPVVNQITKDLRALSNKKQGAPNAAAKTTESGRPAAGAESAVGSSGDGTGVGNTAESTVVERPPVEPAGGNVSDVDGGTGKPNAALVGQPLEPTDVHEGETDVEALKARLKEIGRAHV